MSKSLQQLAIDAGADGEASAEEIAALYREAWADGHITEDEAHALFTLNAAITPSAEWTDFFVETLTNFLLHETEPRNYLDQAHADWLVREIEADGRFESMAELELLVHLMEHALNAPEALKLYAIERIEQAVLTGSGPTRDGGSLEPGCVNATEAHLLRRLVFASGGDGPAWVSRREAEMLFRIKDAVRGANNAPEWHELFVQGVANHLRGFTTEAMSISPERAAQLEAELARNETDRLGFFLRGFTHSPDLAGFRKFLFDKGVFGARGGAVEAGEEVTVEEQSWLDAQIDADGEIDEDERALLRFIAQD